MSTKWIDATAFERDGTSQLSRSLAALSPDYVSVDERTTADFIEFARKLGKTLRYFGDDNQPNGDFGAFIGDIPARDVAAFLEQPDKFNPDASPALFRPHFTLFLVFLKLLQAEQKHLNAFTRRHLDFHFRRFLRMEAKKAVPDRVNLLFSMADRENLVLVPPGTLVSAGVDSIGKDRLYRTEKNLVVNRARIAEVRSVFVERKLISIAQSWHDHRNDPTGGRFEMFRIAYGRPLPGDPLDNYEGTALTEGANLDTLLGKLRTLMQFSATTLHLELAELRQLMQMTNTAGDAQAIALKKTARYNEIIATKSVPTSFSVPGYSTMTLATYWAELGKVETYFGMEIEQFDVLLKKVFGKDEYGANWSGDEWDAAYETNVTFVAALLEQAHHDKIRHERMVEIEDLRAQQSTVDKGYLAILQSALGDTVNVDTGTVTGTDLATRLSAMFAELEDALRAYLSDLDVKKLRESHVAERWDDVCALLAHAMTMRLGKTPPRKIVWRNVFAAADARSVVSTRASANDDGTLPFSTFGAPPAVNADVEPASILGFAITSPILALSAGTRTITLTLGLRAKKSDVDVDFDNLKTVFAKDFADKDAEGRNLSPLAIEVSTADGWRRIKPNAALSKFGEYDTLIGVASTWTHHVQGPTNTPAPGLQLVFTLAEGDPAMVPLPKTPDGMDARWPAIRILMQPVWWSGPESRYVTYYRELTSLFVGSVHVKVTAAGLLPTVMENDDSLIDPKKPFEPFGSLPAVGSRLSFGHPELVTKKIDRVKLTYQWMKTPANLATQYANYGITPTFTAKVRWFDLTGPKDIADGKALFGSDTAAVTDIDLSIANPMPTDHASVTKNSFTGRVKSWRRYLQWELKSPDFQHGVYAEKAAEMALKLSLDLAKNTAQTFDKYQVKPPYTPKLAFMKIEYQSSVEILLHSANPAARLDRTYHVYPFGVAELAAATSSEELPFLPHYDEDSELCIGLANVALPETVTLLLQLDEGSADRDIEAPPVTWSQLSGNRWIPLGKNVVADATRGLQSSGVVELSLQRAQPSTLLPANLTWVRASIAQDHASICDMRALHTQAVSAVFEDRDNAPDHYGTPLPGETITKLKSPIAGIVGLAQPYPSFGGRPAENEQMFSMRVSERLRHKQRALSMWDYERIVLDAFPQIFKAKCIPSTEGEPGEVDVLVIPDVRALPTNELGPKAPIAMLGEIEAFLQARVPACATVNVRNATFRAVRVRFGVHFAETGNESYWMERLEEEITRFLSPWTYDEGADIVIGSKIHASSIVDFVDRRPYIDYVAGITLFYTDDEGERFTFLRPPGDAGGAYCVEAGGADHVLVAYREHRIDVISTEHYDARLYQGISYMEVGMDFVVG